MKREVLQVAHSSNTVAQVVQNLFVSHGSKDFDPTVLGPKPVGMSPEVAKHSKGALSSALTKAVARHSSHSRLLALHTLHPAKQGEASFVFVRSLPQPSGKFASAKQTAPPVNGTLMSFGALQGVQVWWSGKQLGQLVPAAHCFNVCTEAEVSRPKYATSLLATQVFGLLPPTIFKNGFGASHSAQLK